MVPTMLVPGAPEADDTEHSGSPVVDELALEQP
jgi:hypothetical protein